MPPVCFTRGLILKTAALCCLLFPERIGKFAPITVAGCSASSGAWMVYLGTDIKASDRPTPRFPTGFTVAVALYTGGQLATRGAYPDDCARLVSAAILFISLGVYPRHAWRSEQDEVIPACLFFCGGCLWHQQFRRRNLVLVRQLRLSR